MKGALTAETTVAAIDVGTTKICVLVARCSGGEIVDIIGVGKTPSEGLKKGVVVDVAKTVHSIKNALKEAELMTGSKIEEVAVGISGAHIQSYNSHGIVGVKRGQITEQDIDQVIASARAIALPEGQHILHVLPQYFVIDGQERVQNPRGMHGIRLEARVHIITGAVASVQNLISCCEMAGVKVRDVILEQLASAQAVLTSDEQELGVGMLDIGGGTSDFVVYNQGSIRHTKVIPIAGNHFTHDLAMCLGIPLAEAERLKKTYGMVHESGLYEDIFEVSDVDGLHKRIISLQNVYDVLHPRAHELLSLVKEEIHKNALLPSLRTGLVLTGGGSLLRGIDVLAQDIFGVPVRCAKPRMYSSFLESLDTPIHATGYGLLLYALQKGDTASVDGVQESTVARVLSRMKSWVSDFF